MNLSEFFQPFYINNLKGSGLKGISAQHSIVSFFFEAAIGNNESIELPYSEDLYRKWFKGDRSPKNKLYSDIVSILDKESFSKKISDKINDANLPAVIKGFKISLDLNTIPDKTAFSIALAEQFFEICNGNGESDDIVSTLYKQLTKSLISSPYLTGAKEKYSKIKTLLYKDKERNFYDFYVCSHIQSRQNNKYTTIGIGDIDVILSYASFVILTGIGGIGKSMMMRHLFLSSIEKVNECKTFPILAFLREYESSTSLFEFILHAVDRFDPSFSASQLHKLMFDGNCLLLLDGMDEIGGEDAVFFHKQLDALVDKYPRIKIIISSRPFSSFIGIARFQNLSIAEFTKEQSLELVDKLDFSTDEPIIKQTFRQNLISEYYDTHTEFVTNPLLLTLMMMNYRRFAEIPERKHLFYEQAYQTLLREHDLEKFGFKRAYRSVTEITDLTLVLREFCAKSYRKGDYEFDRKKLEGYFEKLSSVKRLNSPLMTLENFLYDICNNVCLLLADGTSYHFLHRAFQEYFFADYYSRQDDEIIRRLGKYIDENKSLLTDDSEALGFLYDLAPEKTERFIFLPFLESIFSDGTSREQYWRFLVKCYNSFYFNALNVKVYNRYSQKYNIYFPFTNCGSCFSSPYSLIYERISSILGFWPELKAEALEESIETSFTFIQPLYATYTEFDNSKEITIMSFVDSLKFKKLYESNAKLAQTYSVISDSNGNPIEFGYIAILVYQMIVDNPEPFYDIIQILENKECPARLFFSSIWKYYKKLKAKYNNIDNEDDDF